MELNVNLKIGFEPQAAALLERLLGCAAAPAPAPAVPAAPVAPRVVVAPMEATTAAPAAPAAVDHKQIIFDAIDRARCRIEGDDWETNPASERRARYHAALSAKLKELAGRLARSYPEFKGEVTKPSELPAYMAEAFAKTADSLEVENGQIVEPLPF